jgi:hypothetical protein
VPDNLPAAVLIDASCEKLAIALECRDDVELLAVAVTRLNRSSVNHD